MQTRCIYVVCAAIGLLLTACGTEFIRVTANGEADPTQREKPGDTSWLGLGRSAFTQMSRGGDVVAAITA